MTNIITLVATVVVSVVTNVGEVQDNTEARATGIQIGSAMITPSWGWNDPTVVIPATERWQVTEVIERTVLTFVWQGKKYEVPKAKSLSRTEKRWVKKETWVAVKEDTE